MTIQVHLLPSLMPAPLPSGSVGVLIDILRASTTIVHALAQGAIEVIPCQTVEEAFDWKQQLLAETPKLAAQPLLGGERHAQLIPGFDLDNSPLKYTRDVVAGRRVIFTTTNGTRALQQCQVADEVLIGAFVNRQAVARRLSTETRPVHLICAGTDGHLTAEDILFAGGLATDVLLSQGKSLSEGLDVQTQLAIDFYQRHGRDPQEFHGTMLASRGGQNLVRLGLTADIERAATENLFDVVPVWTAQSGSIQTASFLMSERLKREDGLGAQDPEF